MFYDEQGKFIHTKKKTLDKNGNVRKGCKIVKKGEIYERKLLVKDVKEKLHVFDSSGLYLATKKIGKNNMGKRHISRKKAYTNDCRIIKEKAQTGKRSSLQKNGRRGKIISSLSLCLSY